MFRQHLPVVLLFALVIVSERARAGTPRDRYVINDLNDTVTDTRTGLIWRRTLDDNEYTWEEAKAYCVGLAGPGAYKLPALKELLTLIDPARSNPAIDTDAFPNVPASKIFWTDSPDASVSGRVWGVLFADGSSSPGFETSRRLRVRCVRYSMPT